MGSETLIIFRTPEIRCYVVIHRHRSCELIQNSRRQVYSDILIVVHTRSVVQRMNLPETRGIMGGDSVDIVSLSKTTGRAA